VPPPPLQSCLRTCPVPPHPPCMPRQPCLVGLALPTCRAHAASERNRMSRPQEPRFQFFGSLRACRDGRNGNAQRRRVHARLREHHAGTAKPPLRASELRSRCRRASEGRLRAPGEGGLLSAAATQIRPLPPPEGRTTCRRFDTEGVPKPTSEMSPRAPAQMGRHEAERERGKVRWPEMGEREVEIPRPSCSSRAQVGCACSRGLQASTRERERAALRERLSRPRPRAANPL
jgi:hypothetical protein